MKNSVVMIVLALALIGIGFVLGCGSTTSVTGNERSITTEEIRAERVFADVVYLMKDNGEPGGILAADDDGGGIMFRSEDEQFVIALTIEKDGPKIIMSDTHGDHHIRLWVRETGPQVALLCKGEPFVGLMAIDWDEGGIVFTSDKHGDPTGGIPLR